MNDKAFEKKVSGDIDNAKNDLATLGDDGLTGLSRMFEQLSDDVKKTVSEAVETINEEVGQKLSQYNDKVQDYADRVPGDFGKKAVGYPWVTITMFLMIGLLLGALLKPGRQ